MNDGRPDQRDSYDTLYVPFVWVPDEAPRPTEWLAQHPDAFWVPARLVRGQANRDGVAAGEDGQDRPLEEHNRHHQLGRNWPQDSNRLARRRGPPPSSLEHYRDRQDPVKAYLQVNEAFTVLGVSPRPGSVVPEVVAEPMPAGAERGIIATEQQDSAAPVPLFDNPVSADHRQIQRPAGLPPEFFIKRGLEDRKVIESLLRNGPGGAVAALAYLESALENFRQGGPWDAQRVGGTYHREFRDYATVAIGLYAAAAGVAENDILGIENIYGWAHSRFSPDEKRDGTYRNLPEANVENTRLGYRLYGAGPPPWH